MGLESLELPRRGRVVRQLQEVQEQASGRRLGERLGRLVHERHAVLVRQRQKRPHFPLGQDDR